MLRASRAVHPIAFGLVVGLLAGCTDLLEPGRAEVAMLDVDPPAPSIEEGDEVQLTATVRADDGKVLSDRRVFWAVEDSSIARVTAGGLLSGIRTGTTRVAASAEGKHAIAPVEVRLRPVATVGLEPNTASIAVRGSVQLAAVLRDVRGGTLEGRSVDWSSQTPEIATVDQTGYVRGVRPGTTWIRAQAEGKSDSAQVRVHAGPPARIAIASGHQQTARVGETLPLPLVIQLLDADSFAVSDAAVTWVVTQGGGTIEALRERTDATGQGSARWLLGNRPGEQRARASVGSLAVTFTATARPGSIFSVSVTPGTLQFSALQDTVRLTATAADAFGNPVADAAVTWSSLDPTVASVDAGGLVRALVGGAARVVAAAEGGADTANIVVQQVVTRLVVTPPSATLNAIGRTALHTATAQDRNGFNVPSPSLAWTSLDPAIATVSGSGQVTARAVGEARIRAVSGSAADTARVRVRQVLARVLVAPASRSLAVTESATFTASAVDSANTTIPGASFQWTSSAPLIASVDQQGRARGLRPGSAYIIAASGGKRDSAQVTVRAGPPAQLGAVSGDGQVGVAGRALAQPLVVRVLDAGGFEVSDVDVAWSITHGGGTIDPETASTDATGRSSARWVLGNRPGEQRARASVGSLVATFRATALPGSIFSVSITPETVAFTALQDTVRLAASAADTFGNPVQDVAFDWSSLNPPVASVGADGLVRALARGDTRVIASAGGRADTAAVQVQQVVTRLIVGPASPTVNALGRSVQLTASAQDRNGYNVPSPSLGWSSLDPAIASVSGSGLVTARAVGQARIRAASGSATDDAVVQVRQVVAGVRVTPGSHTVVVDEAATFRASASDSADAAIPAATFLWSTSAPQIASVDQQGRARGVRPGSAFIIAASEGIRDSAHLSVRSGPPARLDAVSGDDQRGGAGQALPQPLVVRVSDKDRNPIPGVSVAWSTAPGDGSVSPSSAVSDDDGQVAVRWTLGPRPGAQFAAARVGNLETSFRAIARPSPIGQLTERDAIRVVLRTEPADSLAADDLMRREPDPSTRPPLPARAQHASRPVEPAPGS